MSLRSLCGGRLGSGRTTLGTLPPYLLVGAYPAVRCWVMLCPVSLFELLAFLLLRLG